MPFFPKVLKVVADTPVKPNCSLAKIAGIRVIKKLPTVCRPDSTFKE
jgi:hypothetical protein